MTPKEKGVYDWHKLNAGMPTETSVREIAVNVESRSEFWMVFFLRFTNAKIIHVRQVLWWLDGRLPQDTLKESEEIFKQRGRCSC